MCAVLSILHVYTRAKLSVRLAVGWHCGGSQCSATRSQESESQLTGQDGQGIHHGQDYLYVLLIVECPRNSPLSPYTDALSQRSLMLALQWSTFNYQPGDLLLLFSSNLDLYTKVRAEILLYTRLDTILLESYTLCFPQVVSWSGVISSCLDPVTPSCSRLASRVRLACVLMSQLLSMEVG